MSPKAVISLDIDATQYLYGDPSGDEAALVLKSILEEKHKSGEYFVVHNTGRPFPWVCHGEQLERYLNPIIANTPFIISHAGTVINIDEQPLQDWSDGINHIASRSSVEQLVKELQDQHFDISDETESCEYKVGVSTTPEAHATTVETVKNFLDDNYPGMFEVSYWNNTGVDITPAGVNKKSALEYLLSEHGLSNLPIYVAGNSMNDYPVLSEPGYNKIVVGNAAPELRNSMTALPRTFNASAANHAAAGVLEGLLHYGLITEEDITTHKVRITAQPSEANTLKQNPQP